MGDEESDYTDFTDSSSSKSSDDVESFNSNEEHVIINDIQLRLPRRLCGDFKVFKEFFSMETWRDLPGDVQTILRSEFMPQFPSNNENEQDTTLNMFLSQNIHRFGVTPLEKIQKTLEIGGYRSDVLKLRRGLKRSHRRARRYHMCDRISHLSKSLFISRMKLLRATYDLPPESMLKPEKIAINRLIPSSALARAEKRFDDEVMSMTKSTGIGETFSDLTDSFKENVIYDSQSNPRNEQKIIGTMCRRLGPLKRNLTKLGSHMSDSNFRDILISHKKRKLEDPDRPEYETNDIRLRDVHARTQLSGTARKLHCKGLIKKPLKLKQPKGQVRLQTTTVEPLDMPRKEHITDSSKSEENIYTVGSEGHPESSIEKNVENLFEEEQKSGLLNKITTDVVENVTQNKLDNDMDHVETLLVNQGTETLVTTSSKIKNDGNVTVVNADSDSESNLEEDVNLNRKEQTKLPDIEIKRSGHICFFSVIRDIFCSTTNHRIQLGDLTNKVCTWLSNSVTTLIDWYSDAENWLSLIPSAIHFLAGDFSDQPEDFVPYLEYKSNIDIYQWIGAGRDSDQHLLQLYSYWLSRKSEMTNKPVYNSDSSIRQLTDVDDLVLNDKPVSPPPPKCPTMWVVRPYSCEEVDDFRAQEKHRFENPHRAFTYRMHGYESVVGPVKGVYTQIYALSKARGHTMLVADRPNFVTILTLVRDATARLPNGEGTRADICELLKSSQYINPQAQDSILQTIVSGALDRMHTEHDPCVRYDPKRKIWIYLHRNRTEEEFERLHQQYQGIGKHKKITNRKIKQKPTNKQILKFPEETITSVSKTIVLTKTLPTLSSIKNSITHTAATNINNISIKVSPKVQMKAELLPIKPPTKSPEKRDVDAIPLAENLPESSCLLPRSSNFRVLPTLVVDANIQKYTPRKNIQQGTAVSSVSSMSTAIETTASLLPTAVLDLKTVTSTFTTPSVLQPVTSFQSQLLQAEKQHRKFGSAGESLPSPKISKETTASRGPGYVLPISLNNIDHINHINISGISSLTTNARAHQTQSSDVFKQTIAQPTIKSLLKVSSATTQAGKNLIHSHATNNPLQHQKINSIHTSNSPIPGRQLSNAILVNAVKQQHHLNMFNQNQNISSDSKILPRQNTINLQKTVMIPSSQISQGSLHGKQVFFSSQGSVQQLGKIVTPGKGITSLTTTMQPSNIITSHGVSSCQINSQIIRIQQPGQTTNAKVQQSTIDTDQDQAALQGFKKNQKVSQGQLSNQHSLIVKQHPVFRQIQLPTMVACNETMPAINTNPTTNQNIPTKPAVCTKFENISPQTSIAKPTQTLTRVLKTTTPTIHSHALPGFSSQGENQVMTKVLANSPRQIISLESFMEKQGNNASLRIASSKTNQANVIQIGTLGSQYAVVSQGRNIISMGAAQRINTDNIGTTEIIPASVGGNVAEHNLPTLSQCTNLSQPKNSPKIISTNQIQSAATQQLMNAKVLGKASSGSIRMINASNLNITHIRGKPLIITNKAPNIPGQINQNVILQNQINSTPVVIGAQTLKLQGNVITPANVQVVGTSTSAQAQTVVLGNQIIKVQQTLPLKSQSLTPVTNIMSNANLNSNAHNLGTLAVTIPNTAVSSTTNSKTVVLGSTGLRVQPSTNVNGQHSSQSQSMMMGPTFKGISMKSSNNSQQRVVLAVQGGGQIILPAGFQGGAINVKSMQGVKVVSVTQQQSKGQ